MTLKDAWWQIQNFKNEKRKSLLDFDLSLTQDKEEKSVEDPGGTGRGGFGTIQKPIDNLLDKNKEQNIAS